jgi:hypothetical protein
VDGSMISRPSFTDGTRANGFTSGLSGLPPDDLISHKRRPEIGKHLREVLSGCRDLAAETA